MVKLHQAIIVGSGFGGQSAAIRLRQQGIEDFVMLERRSFMGGTWLQNTYPGAAVDVPSPLYSMAAEPYDWSQMYAEQDELAEYTRHIIAKHQLAEKTLLNTTVKEVVWQEDNCCWLVRTETADQGEKIYYGRFLINASGPLSTAVIPEFKGQDSFQGESFHTNDWNHEFDHRGKRVAIIGSGASAAQVIPAIAPEVAELHIFQRTPHWVLPRGDYKFRPWQRGLLKRRWIYRLLRNLIYWQLEFRVVGFKYSRKLLEWIAGGEARRHIQAQIPDPKMRVQVTPEFTIGCKRIILSNSLYPAYCRDNVTLHDKSDGIAEITEQGIVTQKGTELGLDLIVYSTGYDVADGMISYPVQGRNGKTLAETWADYPRAYLGATVPDFPNLFIVTGPNTGIGHTSALFIIEAQMNYIMKAIHAAQRCPKQVVEVTAVAEELYTRNIHQSMGKTVWSYGGCHSWYKSKSGKVIAMFPGFSFTYRLWANRFRALDHQLY